MSVIDTVAILLAMEHFQVRGGDNSDDDEDDPQTHSEIDLKDEASVLKAMFGNKFKLADAAADLAAEDEAKSMAALLRRHVPQNSEDTPQPKLKQMAKSFSIAQTLFGSKTRVEADDGYPTKPKNLYDPVPYMLTFVCMCDVR